MTLIPGSAVGIHPGSSSHTDAWSFKYTRPREESFPPAGPHVFPGTASDVLHCQVDAELVVLSACGTAKSRLYGGGEAEGLSSAFLYAGAASVMSSLWNVDSLATAYFMEQFYDAWHGQRVSKPQAWLHACRSVRSADVHQLLDMLAAREKQAREPEDLLAVAVQKGDLLLLSGQSEASAIAYERALDHADRLRLSVDRAQIGRSLRRATGPTEGGGLRARFDEAVEGPDLPRSARRRNGRDEILDFAVRTRGRENSKRPGRKGRPASRPWSTPFFWAGFKLVGDWRETGEA